jgi:hypothetical protein
MDKFGQFWYYDASKQDNYSKLVMASCCIIVLENNGGK